MLRSQNVLQSKWAALGWGLLLLSLGPTSLAASPFQDDRTRVLLIGDSHSATGDEYISGKEDGQTYLSYADQLELDLAVSHALINIACPGSSLLDWTRESKITPCPPPGDRVVEDLFATLAQPELPVDIVTVLLGTNDSIGWVEPDPVTPEAFATGLDQLLATLLFEGAESIVLMTPPDRPVFPEDRVRLLAYRETILDRCRRLEDLVCGPDLFTLLDSELDFAAGDLHLNAGGHERVASALRETIVQIPEPTAPPLSIVTITSLALLAARRQQVEHAPAR